MRLLWSRIITRHAYIGIPSPHLYVLFPLRKANRTKKGGGGGNKTQIKLNLCNTWRSFGLSLFRQLFK